MVVSDEIKPIRETSKSKAETPVQERKFNKFQQQQQQQQLFSVSNIDDKRAASTLDQSAHHIITPRDALRHAAQALLLYHWLRFRFLQANHGRSHHDLVGEAVGGFVGIFPPEKRALEQHLGPIPTPTFGPSKMSQNTIKQDGLKPQKMRVIVIIQKKIGLCVSRAYVFHRFSMYVCFTKFHPLLTRPRSSIFSTFFASRNHLPTKIPSLDPHERFATPSTTRPWRTSL